MISRPTNREIWIIMQCISGYCIKVEIYNHNSYIHTFHNFFFLSNFIFVHSLFCISLFLCFFIGIFVTYFQLFVGFIRPNISRFSLYYAKNLKTMWIILINLLKICILSLNFKIDT